MKKILYLFLSIISWINLAYATTIEDKMKWIPTNTLWIKNETPLKSIINSVENIIYTILWIIAVWVFMFFWMKLISSRWNEDAYKKAKTWLMYAVAWLAVIPLAMALVKLAASLKL